MKITANFNTKDIEREANLAIKRYINHVVDVYSKAGKAMVEDARSRTKDFAGYGASSFGNITWELRSSIACAVYVDGVQKFFYGPPLETGADGVTAAKDYLSELSAGVNGIQLIVVAGKDYARAVENKGYNVISVTAQGADSILQSYINRA